MTIRLDGREIRGCAYIGESISMPGVLMVELEDSRPLSAIAADFEGVQRVDAVHFYGQRSVYEGFSELIDIRRSQANGNVLLEMQNGNVLLEMQKL